MREQKGYKKGKNHHNWKGDKATRGGSFHRWIERRKPKPESCENCGEKKKLDLANISQEYKRDVNDFEWICRSCHMKKDGRLKNLLKNSPGTRGEMNGKNSPLWKGGLPKCIECESTLSNYKSKRCRKCYLGLKTRGKRNKK